MAKNIVLLSDGTGNSSAKLFKTNVWRLHEALDLTDPTHQVAAYDNGVGTSSFKPLAILGGVFGFGLKRNVLDLYRFCCRTYHPGDRIFGFGFSRGAFTIRIVVGLIAKQGLVPYNGNEAQLRRDAAAAYREFRTGFQITGGLVGPLRRMRDRLIDLWRSILGIDPPRKRIEVDAIQFIGVWDTVAAYGGPIKEITLGIDYWIWPLSMPDRYMSHKVQRACHALALDDERDAFHPVLWDEHCVMGPDGQPIPLERDWRAPTDPGLPDIDRQRLSQVWFTGMHSDVGGGYAQDGLSYVTLEWMMDRARVYGLRLKPAERARLASLANPLDHMNDSRAGLGGYYRYKPRKLAELYAQPSVRRTMRTDLNLAKEGLRNRAPSDATEEPAPMISASAMERIKAGVEGYSPIVLPGQYRVVTARGEVKGHIYETANQAKDRAHRQERSWNLVWWRRLVYFATVMASLFLALMRLIEKRWTGVGAASPFEFLIPLVSGVGRLAPDFLSPWLDAFKAAPERLFLGGLAVIVLTATGNSLKARIGDSMRPIWLERIQGPSKLGHVHIAPPPNDFLFRMRSHRWYRGAFYTLTHWLLPGAFGIVLLLVLVVAGLQLVSRTLFSAADVLGFVCIASKNQTPAEQADAGLVIRFDTKTLCQPTGVTVSSGQRYKVALTITEEWKDDEQISDGPKGFGWKDTSFWQRAFAPIRRLWASDYFQLVVRVGSRGSQEWPLAFEKKEPSQNGQRLYEATLKPTKDGELFLFVNDAVIGLPWIADHFYRRNNHGTADVRITPEGNSELGARVTRIAEPSNCTTPQAIYRSAY
jgi:uncharacterized protein (DUF2235 family)